MNSLFFVFVFLAFHGQRISTGFEFGELADYSAICGQPFEGEFPWLVKVYEITQTKKFLCYGNIIDKYTVVRQAQGVTTYDGTYANPSNFLIDVSKITFKGGDNRRTEYTCRDVIVHSGFAYPHDISHSYTRYDNDIALLKVVDPIGFSSYVHPICLTKDASKIKMENTGQVPTLAYLNEDTNVNVRNTVNVTIRYNQDECQDYYLSMGTFCAGDKNNRYNLCHSQGVGLTWIEEAETKFIWYLKGIVSFGSKGAPDYQHTCALGPVLFTDVFYFYDWIKLYTDN